MKYKALSLEDRIELIIREEINRSDNIFHCIELLTRRMLELVQDEINFRRRHE